jgi:hypothetical protein
MAINTIRARVTQCSVWLRPGDRGSIPGLGKGFSSSLCVQTGSGVHPASYPMGTGVLSRGVKRGRSVTLTTPSSAEVMNE